jgi:menaquinone-9 beta-reductase
MYDLIVIGGGPAGTSAAISAARSGAKVLLLERGRFPRHKVCGEFVSPESLELLGRLLDADHGKLLREAVRVSSARIFVDGRVVQAPIEPAAASIARFDLDDALWASAAHFGAEVRQATVNAIAGHGPFVVKASSDEWEARAVVNASGRWSNLKTGDHSSPDGRSKWIGIKAHFGEDSPAASVDLYFFEGGYCGVQAVGDARINACAMVLANVARTLEDVLRLHPALYERSQQWQRLMEPITVAPLRFEEPQPTKDGLLLAGDAAGFVDPFVGDGISLALRSGALAARCLESCFAGKIRFAEAVRNYAKHYNRELKPVFDSSSRIRRMVALPRAIRNPIVSLMTKAPSITKYLVKKTRIA